MTTKSLTPLEAAVMHDLLDGEHPALTILREQVEKASVSGRQVDTVGFFTAFDVPSDVSRIAKKRRFTIEGSMAEIPGLGHGAGFTLFVVDGAIEKLEGFTLGNDRWPDSTEKFKLLNVPGWPRDLRMLEDPGA